MIYLLDSSIVIYYLRGEQRVIEELGSRRNEGLAISAITVGELYEGIFLSTDSARAEQGLNDFLGLVDVLDINKEIGQIFGRERARLRRAGTPMGDLDLLIGSTALYYEPTLLTSDRDFERMESLDTILF